MCLTPITGVDSRIAVSAKQERIGFLSPTRCTLLRCSEFRRYVSFIPICAIVSDFGEDVVKFEARWSRRIRFGGPRLLDIFLGTTSSTRSEDGQQTYIYIFILRSIFVSISIAIAISISISIYIYIYIDMYVSVGDH